MVSTLRRVFTREEKAAGLSSPAAFEIFGIAPTITGQNITAEAAMRVPAVARAVSLIAEGAGNLPVKLFERGTRASVTDHPAYHLVHEAANPWTSAEALRTDLTADALKHGHGFAVVVRNSLGEALELHRVEPGRVQIETDTLTGEPSYLISTTTAGPARYHYADVLHVAAFNGVSPIVRAREAIGLASAMESHVAKLFANGARPSGIITTEKTLTEEGKGNLAKGWQAAHGAGRSGGTAILDEGMTYQRIAETLTDAQFIENRVEQVREVARAFNVPPPMLFELSRATWSNSEEMGRQFLVFTLAPWLKTWAAAYARCLLTPAERRELYVEFITDDLTTTDTANRAAAYSTYRAAGVMTANEVRAGLNLPPRDDGDVLASPHITPTDATPAASNKNEIPENE
ncbi:phage portal protein [Paracoccus aminovorans]|uniref:phage portal protein n=1 Tax=Paracoccus aminovorans TaxID=34004 RepID=UPI000784A05E|nr:phage portal protein [Paracoccus aminovorans]